MELNEEERIKLMFSNPQFTIGINPEIFDKRLTLKNHIHIWVKCCDKNGHKTYDIKSLKGAPLTYGRVIHVLGMKKFKPICEHTILDNIEPRYPLDGADAFIYNLVMKS